MKIIKMIKEKQKYLEKLRNDNTMLIEQNLELKNMNEMLLSKMKELPNLNDKFNELFEKVKLLKEENDLLKKSMKNNKILEMLNQEQEDEVEEEENINNKKDLKIQSNEINNEGEDNQNLNLEELKMLESLLKNQENNREDNNEKNEMDINKLALLENILKKLEGKNEEDENNQEVEENEENEKNDEELNLKKQLLLEEMIKNLELQGLDKNAEDNQYEENKKEFNNDLLLNKIINKDNKEEFKDKNKQKITPINKTIKIYNKKLLKASPRTIKKVSETNDNENNKNVNLNDLNNNNENEEIENEEEEDEEENAPNQINENFNLYKPTKEGMLSFNLSKKNYTITIPNNFKEEFLQNFDPESSIQYNTLEGLFIIPSNKSNQLFYYSSKKNTINELFLLEENHSGGCLFLDSTSKYIIALGGSESKAVEKFSFETGNLEQLPKLSTHRSKITCNQIGNKIFCFFGISKERPNESIVEYLDLDNIDEGWKEIDFTNNADFNVISGMSCINLNDNELLIIGGLLNDEIPNEKLLTFNIEEKELKKLENNLPDSDDKVYLFTQNTMFNLFVNGEIISFANIDNNNQVHIIDDKLCYDLYLTPKTK